MSATPQGANARSANSPTCVRSCRTGPGKGEYTWAEPKDWTPPTLEELKTWEWKDGRIKTLRQLAAERAAATPPQLTEPQAFEIRNDGRVANDKILSILGRPPRSDEQVEWDATVFRSLDESP